MLVFGEDDARLYVRSANMRLDERKNVIGVLDVARGKLTTHPLADESYLFSIAVSGDQVLALFSEAGAGLFVLDAKTLAVRSHMPAIAGEQVLASKAGAWVIGEAAWAYRVGGEGKAVIRKADRERRWARLEELKSRARAKWDVDHLKYLRDDRRGQTGRLAQDTRA